MVKKGSVFGLALWASERSDKNRFEIFAMCVWEAWNLRNGLIHGSLGKLVGDELEKIMSMVAEFQRARMAAILPFFPCQLAQDTHWRKLPVGRLRIDVDVGFSKVTLCYGIGVIIWDHL